MRAETGVGPSIASGSQVWNGICADLATAPPRSPSATSVTTVSESSPDSAASNTTPKSRLPTWKIRRKKPSAMIASPTALMTNAFFAAATAERPVVVEADQEVRREPDEAPADEQHEQVAALDEQQHREDEERHVREVAALLVVAGHVAVRVGDDQAADAGDDEHHHERERVDEELEADLEVAGLEPRPGGRQLDALVRARAERVDERDDRAGEADEHRQRSRSGPPAGA